MNALHRAPGPWPFALATVAALLVGVRAAGFGGDSSGAPLVWTEVPDAWLDGQIGRAHV